MDAICLGQDRIADHAFKKRGDQNDRFLLGNGGIKTGKGSSLIPAERRGWVHSRQDNRYPIFPAYLHHPANVLCRQRGVKAKKMVVDTGFKNNDVRGKVIVTGQNWQKLKYSLKKPELSRPLLGLKL